MLQLLDDVELQTKPGRKPAEPTDRDMPIFERIHARTMNALATSIREAKFRFQAKGVGENAPAVYETDKKTKKERMVTPEIKDGVYVTARASACWKVHKANEANPGKDELVYIGIPCGNKFMPWLQDKAGNTASRSLIPCKDVVRQLKAFEAQLKDMDKTTAMGKEFWEHAIVNTEPPKQKEAGKTTRNTNKVGSKSEDGQYYCASADQWMDTDWTVVNKMILERDRLLKGEAKAKAEGKTMTKGQSERFAELEAELDGMDLSRH
jgi:hypothetical protein